MKPTIHERDITSEVCQRCAHCCHVTIKLPNTEPRYRTFLRQVGVKILPPPKQGMKDCCDERHDVDIDLGPCPHLRVTETDGSRRYACGIYGTPDFPEMCAEFNCVSWAKAFNQFRMDNRALQSAIRAVEQARSSREPAPPPVPVASAAAVVQPS